MAKKVVTKSAPPVVNSFFRSLDDEGRKQYSAYLVELKKEKGDVIMSRDVWARANCRMLMILEIHECLEAGKISHVHEDNSHSVAHGGKGLRVFEMDTGEKILCLPTDCQYDDWRETYAELMASVIPE